MALQDDVLDTVEGSRVGMICDLCCTCNQDSPALDFVFPQGFGQGDPSVFKHHLLTYFISTRLLRVPEEQFLDVISSPSNPLLLYPETNAPAVTRFCGNCKEIVGEALETFMQVLRLQQRISELGETLSKTLPQQVDESKWMSRKWCLGIILQKLCAVSIYARDNGNKVHNKRSKAATSVHNSCSLIKQEGLDLQDETVQDDDFDSFKQEGGDYDDQNNENDEIASQTKRYKRKRSKIVREDDDDDFKGWHSSDLHEDNSSVQQENQQRTCSKSSSQSQMTSSISTRPGYPCKICTSVFQRPLNLRRHMETHDESTQLHGNKYDCPHCKYPCVSENKLRYHLSTAHKVQSHHKDGREKHINNEDGENVNDKWQLGSISSSKTRSSSSEFETNGVGYSCEVCGSVFQRQLNIKRHFKAHKLSTELHGNKFDCPQCKYPAMSENKLRFHLAKVHKVASINSSQVQNRKKKDENDEFDAEGIACQNIYEEDEDDRESDNYDASTYRCKICKTVYQRRLGYRRHLQAHKLSAQLHGNKYDCPQCKYPALSEFKLRFHLSKRHKDADKNTCTICGFKGQRRHNYEKHMFTKHNIRVGAPMNHDDNDRTDNNVGDATTYPCDKCTMVYKSDRGYSKHQKDHKISLESGHKFDCDECGYPARSEFTLKRHKTQHHPSESMLQCTLCDYKAKTPGLLVPHIMYTHPKVKRPQSRTRFHKKSKWLRNLKNGKFQCELCATCYTHSGTLKNHIKFHEKTKRELNGKWDCKKCGYPSICEENLRKHMSSVHNRVHLYCEKCNKTFAKASIFNLHKRMHKRYDKYLNSTTGMFQCKLCKFQSKSTTGLMLHKRLHPSTSGALLAEAPEEMHLCPQCGNSFNGDAQLKAHIRHKHEGIYKYYCQFCSKGYECQKKLNEHLWTHEKNRVVSRNYVCDVCGCEYQHQRSLVSHIAKFHEGGGGAGKSGIVKKNYRCKWCDMEFQYKFMLVKHLPTAHADLYNYRCDLCTKSYISANSLRLHKEIIHKAASLGKNETGGERAGPLSSTCEYCGKEFQHRHYVICHYNYCPRKRLLVNVPENHNSCQEDAIRNE